MARIGILGDGQLGQLTAQAAQKMGHETVVFGAAGPNSPAAQVSEAIAVTYSDTAGALEAIESAGVDVVTPEWENVPKAIPEGIEAAGIKMYPSSQVLGTIQHRVTEKEAVRASGNKTVEFVPSISSEQELWDCLSASGPGIIKTAREGYDGKGQFRVNNILDVDRFIKLVESGEEKPFGEIDRIYEQLVDFDYEIAVTIARNPRGEIMIFEPSHNTHKNGILDTSFIPAIHSIPLQGRINQDVVDRSKQIAESIAISMGIVGEVTVEMFVTKDGEILVNELAPRPHNSAHGTIESYNISQYQALIMAILDEDLGENPLTSATSLKNMMGNDISFIPGRRSGDGYSHTFLDSGTSYYDYGKGKGVEDGNFPEGRKMGHMTKMVLIKK